MSANHSLSSYAGRCVMKILAAPDKFRGSATAIQISAAISDIGRAQGHEVFEVPLADGGEGTLDSFGGPNRYSVVTGPLGSPVSAGWRIGPDRRAVIETSRACGLLLAGGPKGNDPIRATTRGSGELIAAAIAAGATEIVVGLGGSATTDGGRGAVEVLADFAPLDGSASSPLVQVCWDVQTTFLSAATIFGLQKGADPEQVRELSRRLIAVAEYYDQRFGVDVRELEGSGAAGGLAGGLAALGAQLVPGFLQIARLHGLFDILDRLEPTDLVITGEGRLDPTSFQGKVVGGVLEAARRRQVPVLAFAGVSYVEEQPGLTAISLTDRFGSTASLRDPVGCIRTALADYLSARPSPAG